MFVLAKAYGLQRTTRSFDSLEALTGQVAMNFKTWRDFKVADIEVINARDSFLIQKHYAGVYCPSDQPYIELVRPKRHLKFQYAETTDVWQPTCLFSEYSGSMEKLVLSGSSPEMLYKP